MASGLLARQGGLLGLGGRCCSPQARHYQVGAAHFQVTRQNWLFRDCSLPSQGQPPGARRAMHSLVQAALCSAQLAGAAGHGSGGRFDSVRRQLELCLSQQQQVQQARGALQGRLRWLRQGSWLCAATDGGSGGGGGSGTGGRQLGGNGGGDDEDDEELLSRQQVGSMRLMLMKLWAAVQRHERCQSGANHCSLSAG